MWIILIDDPLHTVCRSLRTSSSSNLICFLKQRISTVSYRLDSRTADFGLSGALRYFIAKPAFGKFSAADYIVLRFIINY